MKSNSSSGIALVVVILVLVLGGGILFFLNTPVAVAPAGGTATTSTQKTYINTSLHYTLAYPDTFTVDTAYSFNALGPDATISGVSFTIPASMAAGTNLSKDSYMSVESIATSTCSAHIFLGDAASTATQNVTDNGITYNVVQGGDAGAGNFYQEYVYAVTGSKPCIAVRYFIHSTNIANYTTGTVQEFNKANLIAAFDGIRHTLKLNQ